MGKSIKLGMLVCSSKTRIMLVGIRGGWKKAEYGSHVEEIDGSWLMLDEPTSFLDHVYLGCTQRECNHY